MTRAVPEPLRCEALIYQGYVDGKHRCGRCATRFREGRQVCWMHGQPFVKAKYIDDGFDRVSIYAATMAIALGDDDSMSPMSIAYVDMILNNQPRITHGAQQSGA
jgi:hypothetical protein